MLVENQKIEIVWNPQQASHFRKLGYKFEKGDIIYVPPEDLQYNSHKRVKVYCDNCGKEVIQTNKQYNRAKNHYCSNKCQQVEKPGRTDSGRRVHHHSRKAYYHGRSQRNEV